MRKSRGIAGILLALAALALFVAGPIMIYEGVHGQNQVRDQLTAQKIVFPAKGSTSLPANLARRRLTRAELTHVRHGRRRCRDGFRSADLRTLVAVRRFIVPRQQHEHEHEPECHAKQEKHVASLCVFHPVALQSRNLHLAYQAVLNRGCFHSV